QTADDAQPRTDGLTKEPALAGDDRFLMQRNPQRGRIGAKRFTDEPGRCDADDRKWMPLDHERRSDDRWIAAVGGLPRVMTQYRDRPPPEPVSFLGQHASTECADAERGEIIPRDVFGSHRSRRRIDAFAAHADEKSTGLKSGDLLELRRVRVEPFEQRKREHAP